MGVNPININRSLLTASRRDRLYWCNFDIPEVIPNNITLDDIIQNDIEHTWLSEEYLNKVLLWNSQQKPLQNATIIGTRSKLPVFTARGYNQSHSGMLLIKHNNKYRYPTRIEAERAMTVPENYTIILNDAQHAKALGNGWSVDVIVHIMEC